MHTAVVGSVSDILDKFKEQSSFGEHSILIYPDRYALRDVYSRACKLALENNEAVIMLLHYERKDDVETHPILCKLVGSILRWEHG